MLGGTEFVAPEHRSGAVRVLSSMPGCPEKGWPLSTRCPSPGQVVYDTLDVGKIDDYIIEGIHEQGQWGKLIARILSGIPMVLPGNTAHRPPHPTRFPTASGMKSGSHREGGAAAVGLES